MTKSLRQESKQRWWDVLATMLVVICLFIASLRLLATRWTENLSIVQGIAFLGVVLGLALGQSIFSPRVSVLFAVAYGIFVIPWRLGVTMEAGVYDWVERLLSMRGRLEVIVSEIVKREPVKDNLLFILAMACLFWVISVHAGYVVTRQANPWKAVIPTGLAVFVVHSFDPLLTRRSWYLAFYLFFALLLVARLVYLHRRQLWRETHTHTPSDVSFDFSRVAVIATIVLVLFAWNIPVLADSLEPVSEAWAAVTRPWQSFKDRFGFAFASLRASVGMVTNMYGESMTLGFGTPLGDNVVLEVEAPPLVMNGARFYWRGRVYDTYNSGGWDNSFNEEMSLNPDSLDLNVPGIDARVEVDLDVTAYDAISLLYVAAQPVWISRPTTASVTNNPDGTVDLESLIANEYIRPGERYETRSSLSTVSIADLREAGTNYPEWVLDNYLQLPDEITPRTYELAQRLATGKETPYDIAQTITNYLRDNIEYVSIIPDAPPNQERIDWFLFDLQQGYCNYYASAEVIMLRSLGIPARLAVGFAQGERVIPIIPNQQPNAAEGPPEETEILPVTYVVRQRDAHAWPEVYFPDIGWVEFEPTTSQDALIRPEGIDLSESNPAAQPERPDEFPSPLSEEDLLGGLDTPAGTSQQGKFWTPRTIMLLTISMLFLFLLIYFIFQVRRGFRLAPFVEQMAIVVPVRLEKGFLRLGIRPPRFISQWAHYVRLPILSRSYMQVNHALDRLGQPPELHETPAERVTHLSSILPPAVEPARTLLSEYQAATYSPHSADEAMAQKAGKEVRKLSYQAILRRWLARFQEPSDKSPRR
jgi:transglutaminase-like putative cysteine protease